jgi:DNA end-binding protein Ku
VARPVWTGSISFGLVNVPVKAYTAVRDHEVHFHQLEKGTGSRIRYRKVSEQSGDEVEGDDIEMGYEVAKGRYVTFEKDELDELKPESTKAIEVTDMVALAEVDPIYYERTYWLGPDGEAGRQAYQLLLAAMEERERVAIGTVVMRNKQYLTAVRPLDGALAMSTMRFADEVVPRREVDGVPDRRTKPDAKALKLATQIVDSLSSDWDPQRYHDTYTEELRERIEAKGEGKEVAPEPSKDRGADVLDLMAALEASLDEAKGRKRRAPRTKATRKPAKATKRPAPKRATKARKSA